MMYENTYAIYGGTGLIDTNPSENSMINDLIDSLFNTVVIWTTKIRNSDDTEDGYYKGDLYLDQNDNQDYYMASQGTSVMTENFIESVQTFQNNNFSTWISAGHHRQLNYMSEMGFGSDSIVYQNWQAVYEALPGLDGILIDYEPYNGFHIDKLTNFTVMLQNIGFPNVIWCVYENRDDWMSALETINGTYPGYVCQFHLMDYPMTRDPNNWVNALPNPGGLGIPIPENFVAPGFEAEGDGKYPTSPSEMTNKLGEYVREGNYYGNIGSAFVWSTDLISKELNMNASAPTPADYAEALLAGVIQPI